MNANNKSNTDEKQAPQNSFLKPLIVRASECYKLMTKARNKGDELSETTKTWLKEKAVEEVLGLKKIVSKLKVFLQFFLVHVLVEKVVLAFVLH